MRYRVLKVSHLIRFKVIWIHHLFNYFFILIIYLYQKTTKLKVWTENTGQKLIKKIVLYCKLGYSTHTIFSKELLDRSTKRLRGRLKPLEQAPFVALNLCTILLQWTVKLKNNLVFKRNLVKWKCLNLGVYFILFIYYFFQNFHRAESEWK